MLNSEKKILVLHGWNSNSREGWFPLVKNEFEPLGYNVIIPDLPGNYFPEYEGWLKAIDDSKPDENSVLIGHSLGGVAILKYLERVEVPVKQVVLAATPIECMHFDQISHFFKEDFNWKKIRENADKINLIYETDDPLVPLEHGQKLADKLDAHLTVLPGGMHLFVLDVKILEKIIRG